MMGAFVWLLENWKLLVSTALLLIAAAFGYNTGSSHVQSQWDSEKQKMQEDFQKKAAADALKILELETIKDANLNRIDGLLANNHALWLRVPKTPCTKPADTGVGVQPAAGGGSLYSISPDPLTRYSSSVGELLGQCDKIVESCRVNAKYLQSLKTK
jgi:hypothetical protein